MSHRCFSFVRPLLFSAPISHLGSAAHRWGGIEIRDLIAAERKDARLCAAIEIRERPSFDIYGEPMDGLINGVGPEISDGPLHYRLVLFRRARHAIIGGEFG